MGPKNSFHGNYLRGFSEMRRNFFR